MQSRTAKVKLCISCFHLVLLEGDSSPHKTLKVRGGANAQAGARRFSLRVRNCKKLDSATARHGCRGSSIRTVQNLRSLKGELEKLEVENLRSNYEFDKLRKKCETLQSNANK